MKNKLFIILMIMVLSIPVAFAKDDYNQTGSTNQDYLLGSGIFNNALTTSTNNLRTLSDGQNVPLVADLDGNGDQEIIVVDSSTVRIFRNSDLEVVDSFNLETSTYSNPVIYDIDGDGFNEIILANEGSGNGNVSILQWNGTAIIRQATLEFNIPTLSDGQNEIMINCRKETGEAFVCIYALASSPQTSGRRNFSIGSFNATNVNNPTTQIETLDTNEQFCFASIPSIAIADFDTADTRKEFIFTAVEFKRLANEDLNIFYVDIADDLTITIDQQIAFSSGFNPHTLTERCDDNIGRFYTSPLVFDVDGSTSNGLETVVGINEDSQDFVMKVFKSTGSVLDTHPALFQADGELLSNPMLSNVFGDSGTVEYCILGHDDDDQEINLLCGSQLTGNIVDTIEFKFATDGRFNVTNTYNKQNMISHMGQHSSSLQDIEGEGLVDTTELITSYGVFQLTDTTFNGSLFVKTMNIIFENPAGDSACILADAEKLGSEDLICLKATSLNYVDDSITNADAEITAVTINPCIDSVIKINSTMQIEVTVTDQNPSVLGQDLVSSEVFIYEGTANEQNSSIINVSSGTVMPHSFTLNATGSNNQIIINGFDTGTGVVDQITQSFTVGTTGVEFGDCETDLDIVITVEEEAVILNATLTEDADENAITIAIVEVSQLSGLAGTTFWLILMIAFSVAIYFRGAQINWPVNTILGAMAVINTLFIIIGARLGILSTGLVVIIVVLGVVIIGAFVGRFITGVRTQT